MRGNSLFNFECSVPLLVTKTKKQKKKPLEKFSQCNQSQVAGALPATGIPVGAGVIRQHSCARGLWRLMGRSPTPGCPAELRSYWVPDASVEPQLDLTVGLRPNEINNSQQSLTLQNVILSNHTV